MGFEMVKMGLDAIRFGFCGEYTLGLGLCILLACFSRAGWSQAGQESEGEPPPAAEAREHVPSASVPAAPQAAAPGHAPPSVPVRPQEKAAERWSIPSFEWGQDGRFELKASVPGLSGLVTVSGTMGHGQTDKSQARSGRVVMDCKDYSDVVAISLSYDEDYKTKLFFLSRQSSDHYQSLIPDGIDAGRSAVWQYDIDGSLNRARQVYGWDQRTTFANMLRYFSDPNHKRRQLNEFVHAIEIDAFSPNHTSDVLMDGATGGVSASGQRRRPPATAGRATAPSAPGYDSPYASPYRYTDEGSRSRRGAGGGYPQYPQYQYDEQGRPYESGGGSYGYPENPGGSQPGYQPSYPEQNYVDPGAATSRRKRQRGPPHPEPGIFDGFNGIGRDLGLFQ